MIGAFVVVLGAGALICGHRVRLRRHTPTSATSPTPAPSPAALQHTLGSTAGTFFAIVLLNASLIGAAALTLSTSYAFGDVFGTKHSLHRSFTRREALLRDLRRDGAAAAGDRADPGRPARRDHDPVQALAGVLLPSATRVPAAAVQRPRGARAVANPPWLNALASVIIGVLVLLSLILMATTVFPNIDVTQLFALPQPRRSPRPAGRVGALRAAHAAPGATGDGRGGGAESRAQHVDDAAAGAARAPGVVARAQGGDADAARLSARGVVLLIVKTVQLAH